MPGATVRRGGDLKWQRRWLEIKGTDATRNWPTAAELTLHCSLGLGRSHAAMVWMVWSGWWRSGFGECCGGRESVVRKVEPPKARPWSGQERDPHPQFQVRTPCTSRGQVHHPSDKFIWLLGYLSFPRSTLPQAAQATSPSTVFPPPPNQAVRTCCIALCCAVLRRAVLVAAGLSRRATPQTPSHPPPLPCLGVCGSLSSVLLSCPPPVLLLLSYSSSSSFAIKPSPKPGAESSGTP